MICEAEQVEFSSKIVWEFQSQMRIWEDKICGVGSVKNTYEYSGRTYSCNWFTMVFLPKPASLRIRVR